MAIGERLASDAPVGELIVMTIGEQIGAICQ